MAWGFVTARLGDRITVKTKASESMLAYVGTLDVRGPQKRQLAQWGPDELETGEAFAAGDTAGYDLHLFGRAQPTQPGKIHVHITVGQQVALDEDIPFSNALGGTTHQEIKVFVR